MRVDPGDPTEIDATSDVNALRIEAHATFDPLWKLGYMSRDEAYLWLSEEMGLLPYEAHFRKMTYPQLRRAIALSAEKIEECRRRFG